MNFDTFSL